MWGLETLSETEGPLENPVQPLHTTDKVTESQEDGAMELFTPGHRGAKLRSRTFRSKFLTF